MGKLVIISPCRNEERYARRTLESMLAQTRRPDLWLVVDDGSTDATPAILDEYASQHDFMEVLRLDDRGHRSVGPGVVDTFYAGHRSLDLAPFEYLCKLDLDLELPPRYFELLLERMEANPRLGTCSGKPYYPGPDGELVSEACGDEMSVGMTKLYRKQCFDEIGGFVHEVMWDGIDCHRCRMAGWQAASWDDEELRFLHLRAMGSSQGSWWQGRKRHGFGQYFMGTGLGYMAASALFRALRPPYLVGGAAMLWGWLSSAATGKPRYEDPDFRAFLRRYQRACLWRGKARATEELDREMESVWKAAHS